MRCHYVTCHVTVLSLIWQIRPDSHDRVRVSHVSDIIICMFYMLSPIGWMIYQFNFDACPCNYNIP